MGAGAVEQLEVSTCLRRTLFMVCFVAMSKSLVNHLYYSHPPRVTLCKGIFLQGQNDGLYQYANLIVEMCMFLE